MIEEIRKVAEAYSLHERERQAQVEEAYAKRREARAHGERRDAQDEPADPLPSAQVP